MTDYTPQFDPQMTSTIHRIVSAYTVLHPISRGELVAQVKRQGFSTNERAVREAIKHLRRAGSLICSTAGTNGGYYYARHMDEYQEFRRREMMAKAEDLLETTRRMDRAAANEFGSMQQMGMF